MLWNFRHLAHHAGIPLSNETDWQMGQMLRAMAKRKGIAPVHVLVEKTAPEPSVPAPHMIAHYPMSLWGPAFAMALEWWGDRTRQLPLL